jgi:hypothetical protein
MRSGAGHGEEDAAVAIVVAEAADLGQPESVAVEGDDRVQTLHVPSDAQLHGPRVGAA